MFRTPWKSGPHRADGSSVLVSVTRLAADRRLALPDIYFRGLRLRRGWPELPGAVGMWLWSEPAGGLSGSVSVWRDDAALHGFLGLPEHVEVMRRYAGRGQVSATTFGVRWPARRQAWARAVDWLSGPSAARRG